MPTLQKSRLLAVILATAMVAGCGGKEPTKSPKGDEPASLAVNAGNGQSAQAGSPVAVNPAVIVKDAQGAAVAGVRVNFTVTQGGGAIGVAGLNTDQNGIASPGQWVLGPTAGPQALRASLATGSIAPVTFTATATSGGGDGEDELVTQTIPASGGTITVNRPGSPLHGASLELEDGALAGGTSITLVEATTTGLQIPSGMAAVGPALGIVSTAGRLQAGGAVRLPMTPVAGKMMMVGFADPVTRQVTVLPTLRQEPGAITALLPSLDGGSIAGVRMGGSLNSSVRQDDLKSLAFMLAINEELLNQDFDSGYRPGVDDWDFPRMAIANLAFLNQSQPIAVADVGVVTTSLWYYVNRRKQGGPPLHGSTQLFPQQPLSSRYGIRWAALAERDVPPVNQTGSLLLTEWGDWATDDLGRFQWMQFRGIKALLLTTFNRPVPVVLIDTDNIDEFNAESHPLAIATRTVGNTLYLAWAGSPGTEIAVQFSEQGMTPFQLPNQNGTANMVNAIGGIHYVNVIDDAKLSAQWARVANQTIGDAEGWPTPKLHWEKAELDTARVYLLDELQQWWQCTQCPDKVPTPSQLPATASHVQRFKAVNMGDGAGSPNLSAGFSSMSLSADDTFDGDERLDRKGFVVYHPVMVEADTWSATAVGWLDWLTVAYRKLELEPSVDEITFSKDTTITIAVTPSETPPAGTRYRWLLRTEDSKDSVETTVPTHTRDLEAGTEGWLIFTALEGEHKRPIARDSIEISSGEPVPYWRFLTVSDADGLIDGDVEGSSDEVDMITRMIAAPGAAMLAIENDVLQLRIRRSGVWSSEVPGPYNASTEWRMILGPASPQNHALGPFFGAWATSSWTQTTTDLDAGSITSQTILGTASYQVKDAGTQTGPAGGVRVTAIRSGTAMTGQISFWIWWVDGESGEVDEGPEAFRFLFTAARIQ